jgi:hypothetical protein
MQTLVFQLTQEYLNDIVNRHLYIIIVQEKLLIITYYSLIKLSLIEADV